MENRIYVIVGASRGLGASLVSKYLENGLDVVGVSRTKGDNIEGIAVWNKTGRFRYVQADIGDPDSVDILKAITEGCGGRPVCIIFNAAVIESDVGLEGSLKFDVFKRVNYTGVDGFCHVLEAFGEYLVSHGGMLVGISSLSAWTPPVRGNKVAYPASKAYLDMALLKASLEQTGTRYDGSSRPFRQGWRWFIADCQIRRGGRKGCKSNPWQLPARKHLYTYTLFHRMQDF